jgi:hypothetical protein
MGKLKIISLCLVFCISSFAWAGKEKKSFRKPTQEAAMDEIEQSLQSLQTPHNCRIVIRYVYRSGTEKIEILPFKVKDPAECAETAKLFQDSYDPKIKAKIVNHVWIDGV